MTYTWDIREVEVYPEMVKDGVSYRDVVHTVHWSYIAEEAGDTQEHIDEFKLPLDDLAQFTPYESLDKATITSWIDSLIPIERKEAMQYALGKSITDRQLPTVSETRTIE